MARSTIVSEVLLFACFVVLVKIPEITTTTTARPLYAKDGFLAGEETPVWLALFEERYPPIPNKEPNFIFRTNSLLSRSIEYWKSSRQNGSFPVRPPRSVDDSESFSITEVFDAPWDAREDSFHSPRPVEKRSTADNEVVYPSVLVVMQYGTLLLEKYGQRFRRRVALESVLYALAFWGSVDSSLRHIQNPRVSLRIAGIVLVLPDKFRYWGWPYTAKTYTAALCPMMDYWKDLVWKGQTFSTGSFDIVAHMTSLGPESENDQCSSELGRPVALAAATKGPPCNLPHQMAGLIFYDDFQFSGLARAITQMSKVLGGNELSPGSVYRRISWTSEALDSISNALKQTSCMSAPKEHYPPGRPVAPILAGEFLRRDKQCAMYGYTYSCWNSTIVDDRASCDYMYCSKKQDSGGTCVQKALPLDGTVCNAEETKICWDGKCVDKL